jgi:hypothetical protein
LAQAYLQSGNPDAAKPHLEKGRQLMEAADRISILEEQLRLNPTDSKLLRELKAQQAILGR